MKLKQSDWETWLANPVTEAFFAAIGAVRDKAIADCNHALWDSEKLWSEGRAEMFRTAAKARAECAEDILGISFSEEDEEENAEPERHPAD